MGAVAVHAAVVVTVAVAVCVVVPVLAPVPVTVPAVVVVVVAAAAAVVVVVECYIFIQIINVDALQFAPGRFVSPPCSSISEMLVSSRRKRMPQFCSFCCCASRLGRWRSITRKNLRFVNISFQNDKTTNY